MKTIRLAIARGNEKGVILIETVVSLLIVSVIALGATMANAQVLNQASRNDDFVTAERQTLNAIYWITRDIQQAQTIQPGGAAGFPLTLQWVEWDFNTTKRVIYSLENNNLKRELSIDGSPSTETLIANYINSDAASTNCT